MRFLLLSALLIATASCAWLPPPVAVTAPAPPPPIALAVPAPPPAIAVAAPAPPPIAVAAPAPFLFAPLAGVFGPPPPGRLTLSNFTYDNARVEAVITGAPDCAVLAGTAPIGFVLPLNGTRIIEAAPGADICWRRAIEAETAPGAAPAMPGWTGWNRAFVASGRSIDSKL